MTVKVRKQPLVDSITHSDFRTSFLTPNEREAESEMEMKQDRGVHNTFRQRDPDVQMDLQSNLQEDPPLDLQADLQMDLQANLQTDLQVQTGLGATQSSPLVSLQFQTETST